MSRIGSGLNAGGLIAKEYSKFQGVDFSDNITSETRSPDALNMWKNYRVLGKQIETRPGIEEQLTFENDVYGLFFYTINNVNHWVIHSGTSLYDYNPDTKKINLIKSTGMNQRKSSFFIYNNILYIIDGINYLKINKLNTQTNNILKIIENFNRCLTLTQLRLLYQFLTENKIDCSRIKTNRNTMLIVC